MTWTTRPADRPANVRALVGAMADLLLGLRDLYQRAGAVLADLERRQPDLLAAADGSFARAAAAVLFPGQVDGLERLLVLSATRCAVEAARAQRATAA